ncbi:MAG: hypothetical protein ACKVVT_09180 [Dehalococcoidia bacterium]
MSKRIWELHGAMLNGAITSTPEGHADIQGLVLSEKAYFLVVRDYRPRQIIDLVEREGVDGAARAIMDHFSDPAALRLSGGRQLVPCRGLEPTPVIRRSDEVRPATTVVRIG